MMKIKKMYKKLNAHRNSLMQKYNAEDLHQVRVGVRRVRSLLKQIPTKSSQKLRKQLSLLIQKTNPARDWDTLLINGETYLTRDEYLNVRPIVENYCVQLHNDVYDALNENIWDASIASSKTYLHRNKKTSEDNALLLSDNYAPVLLRKYIVAYRRNHSNAWHDLRVSVKTLRYQLEHCHSQSKFHKERKKAMIALCKQLQTHLGDWHDSVVHEALIEQLLERRDQYTIETNAIFNHWKLLLGLSGYENINRVKLLFVKHRDLFRQDVIA